MKKLLLLLCIIPAQMSLAQPNENVSLFHRLIIYNAQQEVMIVKFKNTDIWVTPGFYQDSTQFIKKGLHQVASEYGITITDPELRGVFSMRIVNKMQTEMKVRNIFKCNYIDGDLIIPENLGEVRWVSVEEALETITYESIVLFLKQTHENPDSIWGGSLDVVRTEEGRDYQIKEAFYPLVGARE